MLDHLQKTLSQLQTMKYGFQQNNVPQTSWDQHYNSAFFAEVYLLLELWRGVSTFLHNNATWIPQHQLPQRRWGQQGWCVCSHPCPQTCGRGWLLLWFWVTHACTGDRKASREDVEAACCELWRGLQKAHVCSQETVSLSGGEREVCSSISGCSPDTATPSLQ